MSQCVLMEKGNILLKKLQENKGKSLKKIGKRMEMNFESKVTKMGRKRVINVPAKQKGFEPGCKVKVKESYT